MFFEHGDDLKSCLQPDKLEDELRKLDFKDGVIRLPDDIDAYVAHLVTSQLSRLSDKERVYIMISSHGGDAYSSFAIYDEIMRLRSRGVEVVGVVEGLAASAACMIVLQAASVRIARPNARLLMHEVRRWAFQYLETISQLADVVDEMRALEEKVADIIAARACKSIDEVKKMIERKEVWMSAEQALEWGLVDKIENV